MRGPLVILLLFSSVCLFVSPPVTAWSNGGRSINPSNPNYGTHDFIADHALDWVPDGLDFWLRDNHAIYLYGTELPDVSAKDSAGGDGIGDSFKHHVYFGLNGELEDNSSAVRAQESFRQVLGYLAAKDYVNAAKWMGITSHYIDDLGVFGHVMGTKTVWGREVHHNDYENWVLGKTGSYHGSFSSCLKFDGSLKQSTAYALTISLAHDTTFDDSGKGHTAKWMDTNYDTYDAVFTSRVCESLNNAVNAVTDAIYSAGQAASIPELPIGIGPLILAIAITFAVVVPKKLSASALLKNNN